ncbi:subtilisin-like protein [Trametopsis cervina]|nr:subtilisin-like protein [Trametopsis cervina]
MVSRILILAAFVSLALAKPQARTLTVHESLQSAPSGYVKTAAAPADESIKLRIALVQKDMSGLIDKLYDVSDPKSANYREHLTKREAEDFAAPSAETVDKVNTWLKENGLQADQLTSAGDWLSVNIPVSKANEIFDADFSVFTHPQTQKQTVRTLSYSIPADLKEHIELVHPTVTFPNPKGVRPIMHSAVLNNHAERATESLHARATCNGNAITPPCVQSLYGLPTAPSSGAGSQIGVSGYIGQFASQKDLTTFLKQFRPDIPSSTAFKLQTLDGGSNPQGSGQAGDEANLDIQYTVGVATGIPTTFISVGNNFQDGGLEGFLDTVNFVLNESNPPQVLTTSYGNDESDISRALATKLCNAYAQLGARGVSILFASGDGGVGGGQPGERCTTFVPSFPAGCPFITNVGATTLSGTSGETAGTYSSGGFSNYFGIPSYQASAVQSYLSTLGSTNRGKFNTSGRAYPDVAAIGTNVEIIVNGRSEIIFGTSASSPIFASVIALVNDRLLAAGSNVLGFLNPFLYANPGAFHDTTSGSNPGCNTQGFPATKGWDPATGLGTPNFAALLSAAGL